MFDLDAMVDFYTGVLGFMVSDRGPHPSGSPEFAFLSRDPDEHHQVVFVTGREPGTPSQIVQISLKVDSLAELRAMHGIVRADNRATDIRTRAHGISWSMYFKDPEGNTVEIFTPTPWYVHAPSAVPFDFDTMSDTEIFESVKEQVRAKPGFKPYAEWRDDAARRMLEGGHWPCGKA